MGSYQRDWSDEIEKEIGEEMGLSLTENNFSVGDAISDKEVFEIKASSTREYSFNTLANIGQNSLTDYGVFDVISWRDFRKKRFDKEKAVLAKNMSMGHIKNNEPAIRAAIEKLALEDKLAYIRLLSLSDYDKNKLKIFLLNCLLGTCKKKSYKYDIGIEDLSSSNFVLVNSKKEKLILNKKDIFKSIDFDNLLFVFYDNRTHIKVYDSSMEILKISFHWKNKFQGGETPCLNIFLSSVFNEGI